MSNAKKNPKNQAKPTQEELATSLQALIAQGKKEGMIRSVDLNALLEKMELSPERIEEVYAVLEAGTKRARATAAATLRDVRNAMRINYFDDKELIAAQAKAFAEKNAH
jgi:hypothetical protein